METIIGLVMPYILPTIGTAIAGWLVWAITQVLAKIAAKTDDQRKLALLSTLQDLAKRAVLTIEQTVVDTLKKTGKWGTPESYQAALTAALAMLKTQASQVLPDLLKQGIEICDDCLKTLLEAELKKIELKIS